MVQITRLNVRTVFVIFFAKSKGPKAKWKCPKKNADVSEGPEHGKCIRLSGKQFAHEAGENKWKNCKIDSPTKEIEL